MSVFLRRNRYRATVYTDLGKDAVKNCLNRNVVTGQRKEVTKTFAAHYCYILSVL